MTGARQKLTCISGCPDYAQTLRNTHVTISLGTDPAQQNQPLQADTFVKILPVCSGI